MKITMIGSGKVAHHLAQEYHRVGHHVVEIYSRKIKHALKLSRSVNAHALNELKSLNPDSDIYVCAISDDAISEVANNLSIILPQNSIVVHTSGVHGYHVFPAYFRNAGLFYPLQTFSKNIPVDFTSIPIFIDSRYAKTRKKLEAFAKTISNSVIVGINTSKKEQLHLAAVFANNFTNHLFSIADQICKEAQIDFNLLKPLIKQTTKKLDYISAIEGQTGPAIRGDLDTIEKHLRLLKNHPEWKKIYSILSKNIQRN